MQLTNLKTNLTTISSEDAYISKRCNWRDSGRGWSGTHPSLTQIRPTFVSTLSMKIHGIKLRLHIY